MTRAIHGSRARVLTGVALALLLWSTGSSAAPVRRLALLIGVNDGGPERVQLRYATSDAQAMARVLNELGGVTAQDLRLVTDANRDTVLAELTQLRDRVARLRRQGRVQVFVYYSGHADEEGLLLRGERLRYAELRTALDSVAADVRVTVLDACASGSFARRKGGARQPAFLIDASTEVRGQAVITSSSADEASQESDRVGGSFFTHFLVSALRGAADTTHDGRVTLGEAYQFAFSETLARTEGTRGGAQHPNYDLELVGSGDLVLTDLRATTAALSLAPSLDGRLSVRDVQGTLVVELTKTMGRPVELGLSPGRYRVKRDEGNGRLTEGWVELREDHQTEVRPEELGPTGPSEAVVLRGDERALPMQWFNIGALPFFETNSFAGGPVENVLSLSAGIAHAGEIRGAQLSAVGGSVEHRLQGVQLSGALDFADVVVGAQVSGFLAWTHRDLEGLQLSAGVNHADRLWGVQAGLINIGGDVVGTQAGLVNIARSVRGAQVGLVNLADHVEGAPIGLVNLERLTPPHVIAFASDLTVVNVGVQLGNQWVYSVLEAGTLPVRERAGWNLGGGLGLHLLESDRWALDVDLTAQWLNRFSQEGESSQVLGRARLIAALRMLGPMSVFAAPTLNAAFRDDPLGAPSFIPAAQLWHGTTLWPGIQVGVRY